MTKKILKNGISVALALLLAFSLCIPALATEYAESDPHSFTSIDMGDHILYCEYWEDTDGSLRLNYYSENILTASHRIWVDNSNVYTSFDASYSYQHKTRLSTDDGFASNNTPVLYALMEPMGYLQYNFSSSVGCAPRCSIRQSTITETQTKTLTFPKATPEERLFTITTEVLVAGGLALVTASPIAVSIVGALISDGLVVIVDSYVHNHYTDTLLIYTETTTTQATMSGDSFATQTKMYNGFYKWVETTGYNGYSTDYESQGITTYNWTSAFAANQFWEGVFDSIPMPGFTVIR